MLTVIDKHRYADAIFAIDLMLGLILFCTVSYFYQDGPYDKSLLALASLTAALSLGIVNRRGILQNNSF